MSGIPLHVQIRDTVERRVLDGEWPAQFRLPSEFELAEQFNVSRMTVRQAVQNLVDKGVLYRRRGVGTFVSAVLQRDLSKLTSFSEDAAARGILARSQLRKVAVEDPSENLAERLALGAGELVTRVERLRSYDETPAALQTLWVPERLCPELAETDVASGSIYDYLERTRNYRIGWGVQQISSRAPTRAERRLLEMPPTSALLVVERTTFLDDGTPVEVSEAAYRGDEQSFVVTLWR